MNDLLKIKIKGHLRADNNAFYEFQEGKRSLSSLLQVIADNLEEGFNVTEKALNQGKDNG